MSVSDILRRIGVGISSKDLVESVSKELKVSERQAYRKIKAAHENKEIKRHVHQDRTVIYVLPEWPYSDLEHEVNTYFKNREWGWEQTTLNDIANEIGVPPKKIEELAYRYGKHYNIRIGDNIVRYAPNVDAIDPRSKVVSKAIS